MLNTIYSIWGVLQQKIHYRKIVWNSTYKAQRKNWVVFARENDKKNHLRRMMLSI